jgi:predicted DNA-binding transcriptional regulator AlpA
MQGNRSAGPGARQVALGTLPLLHLERPIRVPALPKMARQTFSCGRSKAVLVGKPSRPLRAPHEPQLPAQGAAQAGGGQEVARASQLAETKGAVGGESYVAQDAAPAGLANYEPPLDAPPAGANAGATRETPKPSGKAPDGAGAIAQSAASETTPPAKPLAPPAGSTGLLNEKEAAAVLGLEPATLRNWRVKGQGPRYVQLSRRAVRYSRTDIDEWVASRVRRSTSAPEAGNV